MITAIYYKGEKIELADIKVEFTDYYGHPHSGDIYDYGNSCADIREMEIGEND